VLRFNARLWPPWLPSTSNSRATVVATVTALLLNILLLLEPASAASGAWDWPSIPLHDDLPSLPLTIDLANFAGIPSIVVLADHRDAEALTLALCTQAAPGTCNTAVEADWRAHVARVITSFPPTGWGPDVDSYPMSSVAAALRVSRYSGSIDPATFEEVDAFVKDASVHLVRSGHIRWYRRPVPVPRPSPYPAHPYLDLLRHTLVNFVYQDEGIVVVPPFHRVPFAMSDRSYGKNFPCECKVPRLGGCQKHGSCIPLRCPTCPLKAPSLTLPLLHLDSPLAAVAHSMIGLVRMSNTQYVLQDVVASGVQGDFLEAGVWRGGACILALATLTALDQPQRRVWVVDSFEGLPPPNADAFPVDKNDRLHTMGALLSVSVENVADNFLRYGFNVTAPGTRERVRFVKGFFVDTLPTIEVEVRVHLQWVHLVVSSWAEGYNGTHQHSSASSWTGVD
jgi:hypothetical protein